MTSHRRPRRQVDASLIISVLVTLVILAACAWVIVDASVQVTTCYSAPPGETRPDMSSPWC